MVFLVVLLRFAGADSPPITSPWLLPGRSDTLEASLALLFLVDVRVGLWGSGSGWLALGATLVRLGGMLAAVMCMLMRVRMQVSKS